MLGNRSFEKFVFCSAYVKRSGVDGLADLLSRRKGAVTIYAGMNNRVTSYQGLARLLDCGTELYVFDMGIPNRVFHPKLYLGWGPRNGDLIVGSSNLTDGGLSRNIEAALRWSLESTDVAPGGVVGRIEATFLQIGKSSPKNCFVVSSRGDLDALLAEGMLEGEDLTTVSGRPKRSGQAIGAPAIRLPMDKGRGGGRSGTGRHPGASVGTNGGDFPRGTLLWRKPGLRGTDAQWPPTSNTSPTGNLRFAQARFRYRGRQIDHRSYFKRVAFGQLTWVKCGDTETASATFRIAKLGTVLGTFKLKISHAPKRIAHQGNVPTVLHWGTAIKTVRRARVKGMTLNLFGPVQDGVYAIEFT